MSAGEETAGDMLPAAQRRWTRGSSPRSAGLRATIAATLMLAGLTPLAIFLAVYVFVLEPRLQHAILAEHEQLALEVGAVLNRNLFERIGDVQAFTLNPSARDPAAWRRPGAGPLTQAMNGYVRLYGMYRLTLLVSPEGTVLAANDVDALGRPLATAPLLGRSVAAEPWFRQIRATTSGVLVSPPQTVDLVGQLYGDDGQVLPFSTPVLDARGHIVGFWINFFDFSKVGAIAQDMVDQRQSIQRSDQRFQVVSADGLLIYDTRPTPPHRLEPDLLALLAARRPGAAAVSGVRHGEVVAAAPAPPKFGFAGLGWTAVVREDQSVAFAPVLALRRIVGGVLVLTALAMLAFGLRFGQFLSAPILNLADRMRRLAAGDTASPVEHTEREDDIGAMARAVSVFRKALIEKELGSARQSLAMEAADIGAWDYDVGTDTLVWDARALAIFAVPSGTKFDYAAFLSLLSDRDRDRVSALTQDALDPAGTGLIQTEYQIRGMADGIERWVSVRGRSVIEDGVATRLIGTIVDVTDRKQAEAVLNESEARRALAMELAHIGAWESDVATRSFKGDARSMELFGHPGETEIPYKAWVTALHPQDRQLVIDIIVAALAPMGSRGFEVEHRVVDPRDGRETWIAATGRVLFENDRPVRLIGTMIDVTERRQAEAKLRESEQRRQMAMEVADIWAWEFDPLTWRLSGAGRAVPTDAPVEYDTWVERVHPADREKARADVAAALDPLGDGAYESEYRVIRPGGIERWISVIGRAFFEKGQAVRMIGTAMDITARKQAEMHRELLVNELNHRVKNSLATVQAIAQLTLTAQADPVEARASFIARIIALARAHDVLTNRNWEWADLDDLIANVMASYRTSEDDRVRVAGPLVRLNPKAALAMSTALFELTTNAAKYGALSKDGGRIDLTWTVAGDNFMLDWRETGGPMVSVPQRKGFGFRLIQQGLAAELGGKATTEYPVAGIRFKFEAPLSALRGSP